MFARLATILAFILLLTGAPLRAQYVQTVVDFENFTFPIRPDFGNGYGGQVVIPRPDGSYWEAYLTRLLRNVPAIPSDPTTVIGVRAFVHYGGLVWDIYPPGRAMSFLLLNAGPSDDFDILYNTNTAICLRGERQP